MAQSSSNSLQTHGGGVIRVRLSSFIVDVMKSGRKANIRVRQRLRDKQELSFDLNVVIR